MISPRFLKVEEVEEKLIYLRYRMCKGQVFKGSKVPKGKYFIRFTWLSL